MANGLSRHVVAFQHYYKAVKGRREYDGLLPDLGSIAEKKRGPFPLHTLLSSTKPVPSLAPTSEEVVSWFRPLFLSGEVIES